MTAFPDTTAHEGITATVMGLGRFGGGLGVVRYLLSRGARHVIISDSADGTALAAPLAELREMTGEPLHGGRIVLKLGGHQPEDFTCADLVVASPAVPRPWSNPLLLAARSAGAAVTTEIRLLLHHLNRRQVIGITGSAGKSTTSAMLAHVLRRAGSRVHLGGNIGGSLLMSAQDIGADDHVILELSSFMLYWLQESRAWSNDPPWSPARAVITNITPNHLDWHESFDHYRRCKEHLACRSEPDDRVWFADDGDHPELAPFLVVPGAHNRRNAAIALSVAADVLRTEPIDIAPLLRDFFGLPHRLSLVHEANGCRFYDDSKSTTPEASVLAVRAFGDAARVHLIAGGYDKGSDLTPVAHLAQEIAGLYTIGATGPVIASAAENPARVTTCETLDRAIDAAIARMREGDILLLSPGCASWDQFTDFEARGRAFAEKVQRDCNDLAGC